MCRLTYAFEEYQAEGGDGQLDTRLEALHQALAPLDKPIVDVKVRSPTQIFAAADRGSNPMLNDRVRAGVSLHMLAPGAKLKKGHSVPTC